MRWVEEHGDAVWRFVLARLRCSDAAEEIVQETFIAALQGFGRFEGRSSERSWLLGIAVHKIADRKRAAYRERRTFSRDADQAREDGARLSGSNTAFDDVGRWRSAPRSWRPAARTPLERAELSNAIDRCIESLSPGGSEVIWLRDVLGLGTSEVGVLLGISVTNVWTRLHRARSMLRRCVEKTWGSPEGRDS